MAGRFSGRGFWSFRRDWIMKDPNPSFQVGVSSRRPIGAFGSSGSGSHSGNHSSAHDQKVISILWFSKKTLGGFERPADGVTKNPPEEAEQAALPEAGDGVSGGVTG